MSRDTDVVREELDRWMASFPPDYPPHVVFGDARTLGRGKLIFETAAPNGTRYFGGMWIVYDLKTRKYWTTRHGWLEFCQVLGARKRMIRLWRRIFAYRVVRMGRLRVVGG